MIFTGSTYEISINKIIQDGNGKPADEKSEPEVARRLYDTQPDIAAQEIVHTVRHAHHP
jgi:hypothetical protein